MEHRLSGEATVERTTEREALGLGITSVLLIIAHFSDPAQNTILLIKRRAVQEIDSFPYCTYTLLHYYTKKSEGNYSYRLFIRHTATVSYAQSHST